MGLPSHSQFQYPETGDFEDYKLNEDSLQKGENEIYNRHDTQAS